MKKLENFLITGILGEQVGMGGGLAGTSGGQLMPPELLQNPQKAPENEDLPASNWNWRNHTREENIEQGRKVQKQRDMQGRVADPTMVGRTRPKPANYYSTKDRIRSGGPSWLHAGDARAKAQTNLMQGKELDANDLFYLQYQHERKFSPEDIAIMHKEAGGSQQSYALPKAKSTDPNADPTLFDVSDKKISPAYWVTYQDFEKATGERYDARNPKHRQTFFDLNSSGESTVAPTAGVGQGPAYGSMEYNTMRRRPKNVPKFGTPGARYDRLDDGELAATTPQSRARAQRAADAEEDRKKMEAGIAQRDAEIKAQAEKTVGGELAMDYFKKWADRDTEELNKQKSARQNYIDQIGDSLDNDGSRRIVDVNPSVKRPGDTEWDMDSKTPSMTWDEIEQEPKSERKREGPGSAVGDAQNALVNAAGKLVSDKAKDVSDFLKKNLMTFNPYPEQPQEINVGSAKYTAPTYVVPESEAWNNMSPEEQYAMTITALRREEAHKFFGGREAKKGGFLGFGGERTIRFSEDNSGQTPEETARLNRQAKMLNKLLDGRKDRVDAEEAEADKAWDEAFPAASAGGDNPVVSAAVKTGAGMGVLPVASKGFKKSNLPFNVADVITRLSKNKKFSTKADIPKADIPSDFEDAMEKWRESNAPEKQYDQPLKFVVPGQGFDPETGSVGGMDSEEYQERTKRFSTRNELSQAIRNEFLKITGRTPKEESQADSNLLDIINRRERMKRGLSLDFDNVR
jgi:hypothetical protein